MALRDPVAAYTAASNVEAHLVCGMLIGAGIEATVVEDVSQVGVWVGGVVSQFHKPQVWVERVDRERAGPLLAQYEERAEAAPRAADDADAPSIEVTCEECGQPSDFPAAQRGTVQNCPHCEAYMDIGEDIGFEGWDKAPDGGESEV